MSGWCGARIWRTSRRCCFKKSERLEILIEKILSPLIIRVPHQAHDVAAGVEVERAGFARGSHVDFVRELVSFTPVAGMTAGDEVLPGGEAATGAGNYVVERKFAGGQRGAAILAGVAVAQQNVLPRERARLVRDPAILQQTDDRGHAHGQAGGVQEVPIFFFGHGDALQHQHDGAARGTNIDRLVGGIQHQHGLMQGMAVALLMHAGGEHRCRKVRPHAATEIVKSQGHDFYPRAATGTRCSLASSEVSSGRCPDNEMTSVIFKVRATVATHTRAAPARRRTRAHSEAVVPVV